MALGWYFSTSVDTALTHAATAEQWVMIGIVSVVVLLAVIHGVRTYLKRRRESAAAAALPATSTEAPVAPAQVEPGP
jgi:hypothetical protein